jgi:hypothetical protein
MLSICSLVPCNVWCKQRIGGQDRNKLKSLMRSDIVIHFKCICAQSLGSESWTATHSAAAKQFTR